MEGRPLDWTSFACRFRLRRIDRQDWVWTLAGFLVTLALLLALRPASMWLIRSGLMPIPAHLPRFLDPRIELTGDLYARAAGGVERNWLFLLTSLVVLCFNVVGEELWWRGYILPRQELALGRWAWLMHGLLWTTFHAALWWNLLNLLPLTLGLVYVAARRESTTAGIVTHAFHKLDFFIVTLPLFLFGVGGP
jgi:membrane protease YdiL (CAAX protease family)